MLGQSTIPATGKDDNPDIGSPLLNRKENIDSRKWISCAVYKLPVQIDWIGNAVN